MKIAPIYDPDARKPGPKAVQVDLRVLFTIGMAIWVIATLTVVALKFLGINTAEALTICFFGDAIGIMLLLWEAANRNFYRLLALMPQN